MELSFSRSVLSMSVAAALLAGCGSHAYNGVVPSGDAHNSLQNHKSFYYTGGAQDFTVPAGVTEITVVARGAKGAGYRAFDGGHIMGALGVPLGYKSGDVYGGRLRAVIPVTPREKLIVYVGGDASGEAGGYNGGGAGAYDSFGGLGGGGASDVREGGHTLSDRIVVAAGGGGFGNEAAEASCPTPIGGKGGNLTGGTGIGGRQGYDQCGGGGSGGTQSVGGSGGAGGTDCHPGYDGEAGSNGTFGAGGSGGAGSSTGTSSGGSYSAPGGGGGGGGYYGGGGGGGSCDIYGTWYGGVGGGAGGGSSYAEPSATDVQMWRGWKNPAPNGLVVFSW
jgi:hypothetical protein